MGRLLREHLPLLQGMSLPSEFHDLLGPGDRGFRALELVPVTPKLGQYFGTDQGLLVVRAPTGQGSGLEEGDVILMIGSRAPENPRHAFRILGSYQPGESVKVDVLRQRKRLTVDLQVPDAGPPGPGLRPGPSRPSPVPPTSPTPPADVKGASIAS